MKYISLFSGIGGFEHAIHRVFPQAECVGYSEIKPAAIRVYEKRFPNHKNLGDVRKIENFPAVDLLVGGFPCQSLSKAGDRKGLEDMNKSGLIYELIRLVKLGFEKNPNMHFIVENVASMSKKHLEECTAVLQAACPRPLFVRTLNAGDISMQRRKRVFFTTFQISDLTPLECSWNDVLDPVDSSFNELSDSRIATLNTLVDIGKPVTHTTFARKIDNAWQFVKEESTMPSRWIAYQQHHDTANPRSNTLCGQTRCLVLVDRREGMKIRHLTNAELCRFGGFPSDYLDGLRKTTAINLVGNSVHVAVVEHILHDMFQ